MWAPTEIRGLSWRCRDVGDFQGRVREDFDKDGRRWEIVDRLTGSPVWEGLSRYDLARVMMGVDALLIECNKRRTGEIPKST